jgi:two-component system sensor histidine kinase KdpD
VRREEALVENLLHVARLAAGGYRIEPETFDLRDAATTTRDALLGLAARREVRLELVLPDEAALVSAERRGIEVVLAHLVENALKFTPRGGRVELAVALGAAATSVSVSDTGSGVPLAERRRVFEPFSPAAGATREHAGAGLGLPIVKGILAAHGVPIEAVERPGGGALFRFALPLVRNATAGA